MERPRFFTRKPEHTQGDSQPIPTGKILKTIGVVTVALLVLGMVGVKLWTFGQRVASAWPELWFAFNKPQIVKPVMTTYEKKQTALDAAFVAGTNPDQAVLDSVKQVVDQEMQTKLQAYSFR